MSVWQGQNGAYSRAKLRRIQKVQFGVWGPEQIRDLSVQKQVSENRSQVIPAGCTKTEPYDNGVPVLGGLADPRMGSNDRSIKCMTCGGEEVLIASGKKDYSCPGHFGHIELAEPVYHCGFMREIVDCLSSVCYSCSALKGNKKDPK